MLWVAAVAAGVAALGSYLGSRKKKVKSVLGRDEVRPVALAHRDATLDYIKSKPGLTDQEKNLQRERTEEGIQGAKRGYLSRVKSTIAQRGYRGGMELDAEYRAEELAARERRQANIDMILAEHTLRESDIVRRAAVGANFVWPADAAVRGAAGVNPAPLAGLGEALGAGAAAYGAASKQE